MKRKTVIRSVIVCVGILYLLVVALATVYAQSSHQNSLPEVRLAIPEGGEISWSNINQDSDGQYYVDAVIQEDGPWGKRYLVKHIVLVNFRELDEETVVVFGDTEIDAPIVADSSKELYVGVEVRLVE